MTHTEQAYTSYVSSILFVVERLTNGKLQRPNTHEQYGQEFQNFMRPWEGGGNYKRSTASTDGEFSDKSQNKQAAQ